MNIDQIINDIKVGRIDINNQQLFFSLLIKGLLLKLDDDILIRNISIPHIIIHTGSDEMYLEKKGYDFSKEPLDVSNESYIYNIIPRCVVKPSGIDLLPDQLTNPYSIGTFQYESETDIFTFSSEYRRMPLKLTVDLEYYTDSFRDMMELTQQIITKLCFIRIFHITYLGQMITCSYKIPESFSGEYMTELDGQTTESKSRKLNISIEVETNLPVISQKTVMDASKYSKSFNHGIKL